MLRYIFEDSVEKSGWRQMTGWSKEEKKKENEVSYQELVVKDTEFVFFPPL